VKDAYVRSGNVVSPNGMLMIPFDCDGVPEGAVFKYARSSKPPGGQNLFVAEMHNTNMVGKFAFFEINSQHKLP
jgi:hypothetical protein